MDNHGPHSNSSVFFITTEPCKWMENTKVCFGEVTEGMDVIKNI